MKRRDFLIKSAIGGVGLSLIPSIVISKADYSLINIGKIHYHNRHGNLFATEPFKVNHNFIKKLTREVFYKNGYSSSNEDAYKITINNKSFFITPTNKNIVHMYKNMQLVFVENAKISLFKEDILIPLVESENAINITKATKRVIKSPHIIIKKSIS